MYVGEISSDECRGALGSFMQLGIVIGILYVYCVGPYVSFVSYQCYCLIIPIIFIGTFFFMPDSPHYYIQKGQEEAAVKSLKFLRGKSTEGVQEELDAIRATVEESMRNQGTVKDVFSNSANKKGDLHRFGSTQGS
jgi:SP family facilitated glucose transporter-like MFS transporter 8